MLRQHFFAIPLLLFTHLQTQHLLGCRSVWFFIRFRFLSLSLSSPSKLKLIYLKKCFILTRWLKMQKISKTRRREWTYECDSRVSCRGMNEAWDRIVRQIEHEILSDISHIDGWVGGDISVRSPYVTWPIDPSQWLRSSSNLVRTRQIYVNWKVDWGKSEQASEPMLFDYRFCLRKHKLYLWLSLLRFIWWAFVNYHLRLCTCVSQFASGTYFRSIIIVLAFSHFAPHTHTHVRTHKRQERIIYEQL